VSRAGNVNSDVRHGGRTLQSAGGGAAYSNVFNLEEQAAGRQWVNPLVVGVFFLRYAARTLRDALRDRAE